MQIRKYVSSLTVAAAICLAFAPSTFAAVSVPISTTEDAVGAIIGGLLAIAFLFAIYLMPTIVAAARGHNNALPIFIVNLLLGWSFFGWIIPLIWACTSDGEGRNCCKMPPASLPIQGSGEADSEYLMRIKRLYAA